MHCYTVHLSGEKFLYKTSPTYSLGLTQKVFYFLLKCGPYDLKYFVFKHLYFFRISSAIFLSFEGIWKINSGEKFAKIEYLPEKKISLRSENKYFTLLTYPKYYM